MNERIKQLLIQSEVFNKDGTVLKDVTGYELNKFAELIVRECVGIVENLSPGYKDYRDQIEDAFRRDCVIEIKKHFGVEL